MDHDILITGGTGFIGGYLVELLLREHEYTLHLVCRNLPVDVQPNPRIIVHVGDVCDGDFMSTLVMDLKPFAIYHLASVISYQKKDRCIMEDVNVKSVQYILDAMVKLKKLRFDCRMVYCSSMAAIGGNEMSSDNLLDESSVFSERIAKLDLGYFETKRKAEALVLSYCKEFSVDCVIVNPTTVYGAKDALKSSRKTQLKIAQGKFPFYSSGGINIVHVDDVVRGMVCAFQRGKRGERYILGGDNLTIKKTFALIAEEGGSVAPWIYLPSMFTKALGYVGVLPYEKTLVANMYFWYSSQKAIDEIGYTFTPARIALKDSVHWMRLNYPKETFKNSDASLRFLLLILLVSIFIYSSILLSSSNIHSIHFSS